MKRKVVVTQEHLDKGERFLSVACPLALALNDLGYKLAQVTSEEIIAIGNWGDRSPLSTAAKRFIYDFDSGGNPLPATFILDLPPLEKKP